jgi:hypothetical protein
MTKQLFYPVKYTTQPSKIDGKPYTTIIFEDVATGDEYLTYVYSKCRNKALWKDIIDHQDWDQMIFFDDLVIKSKGKSIIDADCKPQVLAREARGQLRVAIDDFRREEAAKNQPRPKPAETINPVKKKPKKTVVKFKKSKPSKPRPQLPPDLWEI